ncbi:MAG: hypothetical protein ABIC91_07255 [Nanoarchaeota archaeon]|nr:hypothetical protein [Nanoarchaeota archaeon]MBU1849573.1 hypothetical protein [Nanoarchaeota archaeon]
MPELLLKQKLSKKQSVEMYEGQKALFAVFNELIANAKTNEEYLVFSINEENKSKQINLFLRNITLKRKEKKLDVKLLKNMKYYVKEKHSKLKLRYTNFNLPQGITIFQDKVIILSWEKDPMAIKIESETFAKQLREFFLELWTVAKE